MSDNFIYASVNINGTVNIYNDITNITVYEDVYYVRINKTDDTATVYTKEEFLLSLEKK